VQAAEAPAVKLGAFELQRKPGVVVGAREIARAVLVVLGERVVGARDVLHALRMMRRSDASATSCSPRRRETLAESQAALARSSARWLACSTAPAKRVARSSSPARAATWA
jgi:hypothetical protein